MQLDDRFTFGKYQGSTLAQVIHGDPSYIEWLVLMDITQFDEEALEAISKAGIA